MVVDHLVKARHHTLRICGYLDFYQSTYQHIRTPLFISSLWNTFYLLLSVILHHTHQSNYEDYCRISQWFTPMNYILLLTTFELIIIVPVYVNYISKYFKIQIFFITCCISFFFLVKIWNIFVDNKVLFKMTLYFLI